jgi:hypothetical protein
VAYAPRQLCRTIDGDALSVLKSTGREIGNVRWATRVSECAVRPGPVDEPYGRGRVSSQFSKGHWMLLLRPSNVCPEMNSEVDGNRVCFTHGISSHKRAVLPSLPRRDTAEHATQPIGLLPHL